VMFPRAAPVPALTAQFAPATVAHPPRIDVPVFAVVVWIVLVVFFYVW